MSTSAYFFSTTQGGNPTGNRFISEECPSSRTGFFSPFVTSHQDNTNRAQWIIGSKNSSSLHYLSVNIDGSIDRISFDEALENVTLEGEWPPTRPLVANTGPLLLEPFFSPTGTSEYSSAIPTPMGEMLYISQDQRLMVVRNATVEEIDDSIKEVLVDGNIVYSKVNQMWAVYSGMTNSRYVHGVLGDNSEGYKLNILNIQNGNIVPVSSVELPGESLVYEGLNPMWSDIDGDGIEDVLTTIAIGNRGAALRVYFMNEDGTIRDEVSSDYIGNDGQWLHLLAVGPFGPDGEKEIVEIRTPHFNGRARYYQYNPKTNALDNKAEGAQYTTHDARSRNMDQVIAGDFNNDGIPEVVVQDQEKNFLYGLQRESDGQVRQFWKVSLSAGVASNIALACSEEDGPQLLFTTSDNVMMRVQFVPTDEEPVPISAAVNPLMTNCCAPALFILLFLLTRPILS